MWMRIRNTHHIAFIFKAKQVLYSGLPTKVDCLLLPDLDDCFNCLQRHLGYSKVVSWAVTYYASYALGRAHVIWRMWLLWMYRSIFSYAGMIVVEGIDALIEGIGSA
jgi:hypothetical protein